MQWLESIGAPWLWLTAGVLMAAAEMVLPGVYLLWLGLAAMVTGFMTWELGLSLPLQVVDFVGLSLAAAFAVRRFLAESPIDGADPLLNRRGARLVGRTAVVAQAIEHGSGRVRVGDGEWIARGPEAAAGQRVRIVGHDGASLLVEPIAELERPPAGS